MGQRPVASSAKDEPRTPEEMSAFAVIHYNRRVEIDTIAYSDELAFSQEMSDLSLVYPLSSNSLRVTRQTLVSSNFNIFAMDTVLSTAGTRIGERRHLAHFCGRSIGPVKKGSAHVSAPEVV